VEWNELVQDSGIVLELWAPQIAGNYLARTVVLSRKTLLSVVT